MFVCLFISFSSAKSINIKISVHCARVHRTHCVVGVQPIAFVELSNVACIKVYTDRKASLVRALVPPNGRVHFVCMKLAL